MIISFGVDPHINMNYDDRGLYYAVMKFVANALELKRETENFVKFGDTDKICVINRNRTWNLSIQ